MINASQIEMIEATPDTVITLINDRKLIVRESIEEIREKVIEYHSRIFQVGWIGSKKEEAQ
ncbi:MAG: flagellar FlbD family protein [Leptospiraceae bacterium]|nr:flagellar FlbD family protein [Leptospiraceae bacterium]